MLTCHDIALDVLLAADEDIDAHNPEVARHVEICAHCQSRLTQLAADAEQWDEMQRWLSPDDVKDAEYAESLGARERSKRTVAWTDAMAKSLLSPASHPEMLGRIGRYDVERLIGSGGMGVVFKAYDTELNRPVAVKLLAPYLASSGAARKRFAREARAAAAVVDDHVVPIHNVETGSDSDGEHPFLVMKYIAGGSLQQRLDREGSLEVCEVLRIGMQTAKGLVAAHAQGLIHRDVKPSNILLDEGVDRALLTDFGLARATDDASLTRSGFHPGTLHYMSPEQVRGEAIDARSDLFGLGCVLYALCTGHPPFRSETSYAVLRRITDDTPRPIRETNPNIPDWLEQIVMKLLAKSANDRFDSAEQVAELLEACLAHVQQPTTTPLPKSITEFAPGKNHRPPIGKLISAAAFAFSLIFAGVLILLELDKGTLTIECDADDVPIRIMQGDTVVERLTVTKNGNSVRVAAGNYVVAVDGRFDVKVVGGGNISLQRGETDVVKIVMAAKPLKLSESGGAIKMDKPPQDDARHFVGFREYWQHLTGIRVGGNNPGYIQNNTKLRGGLWIGEVDAGSPAAMAGITSRDALVGLGPWEILSKSDLRFVVRKLRMGKLESTNLKVHFFRIGEGLLSGNFTLDTKKITDIGTLVLSSKFRPGDLNGLRFGKREDSGRPRPILVPKSVKPEESIDDSSTSPTLGNGIEEVGLIIGVVPPQTGSEPTAELFLVQASGVRKIETNPTRFTQSVSHVGQPQPSKQSFRVGFEYYALTFATKKKTRLTLEMMAGSAHVYVMDVVGLPNEQVRMSLHDDDICEPWLPAAIPMDQQSMWAARLMNLDDWEKKSDLIYTHVVAHEFNLQPGETRTVSIVGPGDEEKVSDTQKPKAGKTNPLQARTLDEVTSAYNECTRELRLELFHPPIPDLTKEQMIAAMLDGAARYRRQGKTLIASLEESVKEDRLAETLKFNPMTGSASLDFFQIAAHFLFQDNPYQGTSVILPKAEVRYSRNGWSSPTWGDLHPPVTGMWILVSVEERGETLSIESFEEWKQKHTDWTRLTIDDKSLSMAGDDFKTYDFAVVYDSGVLAEFRLSEEGVTKYEGVLMSAAFVDHTKLHLAVDLEGNSKPMTFHTSDGKATQLAYHRVAKPQ